MKFIRDQALAAVTQLQVQDDREKHRGAAASAQAAAHAFKKILIGGSDGDPNPGIECSDDPLPFANATADLDPMRGWSDGVSLQKGHFCLLLKPQLVLRSETSSEAVCVLAAVQGKLQTYNIIDEANADDPVSGKVMSR